MVRFAGTEEQKPILGIPLVSGLPLFVFSHSPSSFRSTLKTFGLPSESLCAKCHQYLHSSKAYADLRAVWLVWPSIRDLELQKVLIRQHFAPSITNFFSVSYILREKPWSPTFSMHGYLAGSGRPWSPEAIYRLFLIIAKNQSSKFQRIKVPMQKFKVS